MSHALQALLASYACASQEDTIQAFKEIMQLIILRGLARTTFFQKAAFYGGTALRIIHGIQRFSEDLDFTLLESDPSFDTKSAQKAVLTELESFGIEALWQNKIKNSSSQTVIISCPVLETRAALQPKLPPPKGIHHRQKITINLEVDTNPPGCFTTEVVSILHPTPFALRSVRLPDLFARNIQSLLDPSHNGHWYDFSWFVQRQVKLHLGHLEARLQHGGQWQGPLDAHDCQRLYQERVASLDIDLAKQDIWPFVQDRRELEIWSKDFFRTLGQRLCFSN